MTRTSGAKRRAIDPILHIPVHSPVTSLCFVRSRESLAVEYANQSIEDEYDDHNNGESSVDYEEDDDFSDDEERNFRSTSLHSEMLNSLPCQQGKGGVLKDRYLATCHSAGEALLWDLNHQRQAGTISDSRGGAGVCIRRTDDHDRILYQTRDPKGLVSIHSIEAGNTSLPIRYFETHSKTFCQAAPCRGDTNLLALPSSDTSTVTIADARSDARIGTYSIDGHGMVTSLSLAVTENESNNICRPILACGMESGSVVFFDVGNDSSAPITEASFSAGKDPVLALDMIPSNVVSTAEVSSSIYPKSTRAMLVACGMAGHAEDVAELDTNNAGRAVLFKTLCRSKEEENENKWEFKHRARLSTCRVDREIFNGKPGVSVCRFRNDDGRLLAVGGWDKRIRLFHRSNGKPLGILRGNAGSIVDLDWAPDSNQSGLLASSNKGEKLIKLWRCFEKR